MRKALSHSNETDRQLLLAMARNRLPECSMKAFPGPAKAAPLQ
jgi:hypothetical protein